eukprot:624257-Pelagomonas_calceolata.AAC.6
MPVSHRHPVSGFVHAVLLTVTASGLEFCILVISLVCVCPSPARQWGKAAGQQGSGAARQWDSKAVGQQGSEAAT